MAETPAEQGSGRSCGETWTIYNLVLPVGERKGDGLTDLVARMPEGTLMPYSADGSGALLNTTRRIGAGWNICPLVYSPGDFTGIVSPTSSHAPAVDCCTFMQATDRVDGCNLGSSVEDGTCSPPSSALGTSMVAASPTLLLTAGMAPCGCIPVTAPVAFCSARLWARGGVSSPRSLPEALADRKSTRLNSSH